MKSNKRLVVFETSEDAMVAFLDGEYIGHDDQVDFQWLVEKLGVSEQIDLSMDEFDEHVEGLHSLADVVDWR